MTRFQRIGSLLLCLGLCLKPVLAGESAGGHAHAEQQVVVVARAWWDAFARGDVEALDVRTAPALSLTLSLGTRLDRGQALEQAARHAGSAYAGTEWSEEQVRVIAPNVAIAASTAAEGFGRQRTTYRYLTVLERKGHVWRVGAAQSTRVLQATPRLSPAEAGDLTAYAGMYQTPAGAAIRISAEAGALMLGEPGGDSRRLEPIGRDLFELAELQFSSGLLRFLFVRDPAGRVIGLTRLGPQITTFPRATP